MAAAGSGNLDIVRQLLKAGADVNGKNKHGDTALAWAAWYCKQAAVQVLIDNGADVNVQREGPRSTPLMLGVKCGDDAIVKMLLAHGANPNVKSRLGDTALAWAAWDCKAALVQLLVDSGADANTQHEGPGSTPLMLGVECGDDVIVKMLLSHGANPNVKNKVGMTALHASVRKGNSQFVKALLDTGATVDQAARSISVYYAPSNGHDPYAKVPACLSHWRIIYSCSSDRDWTQLMITVQRGDVTTMALLLKAGANINASNNHGETALLMAIKTTDYDVVAMLVKHGADVNVADKKGKTALSYALDAGLEEMASMLRQAGAKQ